MLLLATLTEMANDDDDDFEVTEAPNFILDWMKIRGIPNIEALAERMDESYFNVRRWIRGERKLRPQRVALFAKALQISPADVFRSPLEASRDSLLSGLSEGDKAEILSFIEFKRRASERPR